MMKNLFQGCSIKCMYVCILNANLVNFSPCLFYQISHSVVQFLTMCSEQLFSVLYEQIPLTTEELNILVAFSSILSPTPWRWFRYLWLQWPNMCADEDDPGLGVFCCRTLWLEEVQSLEWKPCWFVYMYLASYLKQFLSSQILRVK